MMDETKYDHYVLERDGDFTIVTVLSGNDPLYGMGSWNYFSGPYKNHWEAEAKLLRMG